MDKNITNNNKTVFLQKYKNDIHINNSILITFSNKWLEFLFNNIKWFPFEKKNL